MSDQPTTPEPKKAKEGSVDPMIRVMGEFEALDPQYKQAIVLESLKDGSLKFERLTEAYVAHLERQREISDRKITKAVQWIASYWHGGKLAKRPFTRAGAAYFIVKNDYMHGASVQADMEQYLADNPYEEDDNGFPKTELL